MKLEEGQIKNKKNEKKINFWNVIFWIIFIILIAIGIYALFR